MTSRKQASKGKLAPYRAKRDFTKTAEPAGDRRVARAPQLRFVVQKHAATRLHYDLRLELDGVFKSWAVTKGPSLDPADKRLAVEVEDHPLDYGDFEGAIPKGEYGGGTVMLWDRGFWAPEPGHDPHEGLAKGELKLVLAGERLQGGWVLVRLKPREGEKRANWLLIKHRDRYVRENGDVVLQEEDRSVASGRTMADIAAGKGRKPAPFMLEAVTPANAVWSTKPAASAASARAKSRSAAPSGKRIEEMPSFVAPQLCRASSTPPTGSGWGHEVKLDGYRLQLRVEGGRVTLRTRKGLDWTDRFPALARAAAGLPDVVIDGELVALDARGDPSFPKLQEAIARGKTDALVYFAFDLLVAEGRDLRDLPLAERKARLEALIAGAGPRIRYTRHFEASGKAVMKAADEMGLEGIVSKRLDAPYRSGRSAAWVKTKRRPSESVVIGGWVEEDGRFRSLLAGAPERKGLRYLGRVGTGYGGRAAEALLATLKANEALRSPFLADPVLEGGRRARWARPALVAEVEHAGWTGEGLMREAAFKGLREDLDAADVRIEPGAAPPPSPPPPARVRSADAVEVGGVTVSSADKVLWPAADGAQAVAKRDLAAYYQAVGAWMLPHYAGRPCSIVRAPDGIGRKTFFQRHALEGGSEPFTLVQVRGDKQPYLQIDSLRALIAAAQLAAVELHPWNCAPGRPEVPGRLVFDLDPAPDIAFDRVVEAARELRDRLAALGLESVCKTTGGKGLHVVTPLRPPPGADLGWPEAKAFAHEVCRRMAADSPRAYLTTMAKARRSGRIYLDYLRNDRSATAVGPLSPRARPGAPVSMPLTWAQVRKGLDASRFTIAAAPAALARSRAWDGYEEAARPLRAAAQRLLGGRGR